MLSEKEYGYVVNAAIADLGEKSPGTNSWILRDATHHACNLARPAAHRENASRVSDGS